MKYGLTREQYDKMVQECDSTCAICNKKVEKICVDHDHKTGKIRGLLCHNCNTSIGLLCEDEQNFANAVNYLHKHKEPIDYAFPEGFYVD
jgi:hypothetical protein